MAAGFCTATGKIVGRRTGHDGPMIEAIPANRAPAVGPLPMRAGPAEPVSDPTAFVFHPAAAAPGFAATAFWLFTLIRAILKGRKAGVA